MKKFRMAFGAAITGVVTALVIIPFCVEAHAADMRQRLSCEAAGGVAVRGWVTWHGSAKICVRRSAIITDAY
jgi:hypothetical protein